MDETMLLLAGGRARRFPGKLEHPIEGKAMILRVFDRLRAWQRPIVVAGRGSFPAEIDAALQAPLLIDRQPDRGPLCALIWAAAALRSPRIAVAAGDLPNLDAGVFARLSAAWQPGDAAVVPEHDGRMEPLAAIYDRFALLDAGAQLRRRGRAAMHDLLEALTARRLPMDGAAFVNVNHP